MKIDTHCHINDEKLITKLDEVIKRSFDNGVKKLIVSGWDYASSVAAVEIACKYDGVFATVGFHPENLSDISEEQLLKIEELTLNKKVIAIGEIGLDYHWFKDEDSKENQKLWFIKQIDLANRLGLPVCIHARDASEAVFNILSNHPINKGCVLHCYSGSPEMAQRFIPLGVYFGFDGPITFKNAESPRECVRSIPLDRLLTETDCPYMTPAPFRGRDNEPMYIPLILEKMAELKGLSIEKMEEQIKENCRKLYGI